jgi:hypothetical protein
MIANTFVACDKSGMPRPHADCFQQVASATRCVIACRSVGRYATGLILENYASKGFHVKAKSCNWGPIAGFVLSDPRFTKRGASREARESQRKDVHAAIFREHAGEIQVYLTENRRKELERMGCMVRAGGTINEMVYSGRSRDGKTMRFVLRREMEGPGAHGLQLWAVFYYASEVALPASPVARNRAAAGELLPVMALVNPQSPATVRNTYRAAMTGDYDLWAVFPPASEFQPRGLDQRPVPGSNRFVVPIRTFAHHEHPDMGNITGRVMDIKNRLNSAIRSAGYTGGDMVHHSDEAGRPLVAEVELEFIAFIPDEAGRARFVKSLLDLRQFMREVIKDYYITFNPGWGRQLGFTATPGGNWEV